MMTPDEFDADTDYWATLADEPSGLAPTEQHHGQVRMAYRLADAYSGQLMHVARVGWFHWDGRRWAEDERGMARRAVLDVLRRALTESLGGDKVLRADVARCETDAGIAGVLGVAASMEPFARTVTDIDPDPYLLNVANGTLDLRTMAVHAHTPTDLITKITRAAYHPDTAPTGVWDAFLASVLPDATVRDFLRRVAGVALLGKVVEHILAIETGIGANGKGTSYKAILWALGDYADTADPDLFMAREGAHPTGEMDLRGLRLVVVSENDRNRKLAEATMKRLTGGDPIKARRMRQDFVTFEPSHTAVLVTNHLPRVSGDDPAIWRRIRVIPFDVVFTDDEKDPALDDKLRLVADEVLAWAVEGYREYTRIGMAEPATVKVATSNYQLESDLIARFIADQCLINPHVSAITKELFAEFEAWADAYGAETMNAKTFGQALDRKGFPVSKSHGRRVRRGIRPFTSAEEESDDA